MGGRIQTGNGEIDEYITGNQLLSQISICRKMCIIRKCLESETGIIYGTIGKRNQTGRRGNKRINPLFFEEETWLIEKIAMEVSTTGILFFESVEGEIDEGVHAYDGFFVTPAKEVYYSNCHTTPTWKWIPGAGLK